MRTPHSQSHMTLQYRGHVTNKKRYIFTCTRPMNPKLSRVVIQDEGTSPTTLCDTITTWSRDKSKMLHLHFHKAYGPQTQQGGEIHPLSHVTLQLCGHVTNQKYFVFPFTRHKVHKLSRMVTRMRRPHPTCHVPPRSRRHAATIQQVVYICSTSS